MLYHNLHHTRYVVSKVENIAHYYHLEENEIFVLTVAAWFHDTGQLYEYGNNHEAKSVALMKDFFAGAEVENAIVDLIADCILATKVPHSPNNFLQEIICDADTFNLGTKDFFVTDKLLKTECELKQHSKINNWDSMTLKFLEAHTYFTSYCKHFLDKDKQNNISYIRLKLEQLND